MVPAITAGGRSFRGAALYYAHDKRRDGEAVRFTTNRVAWVETVNLPTGDPERAWRIMAHTALAQGRIESGGGNKGDRAQTRKTRVRLQHRMASGGEADQSRNDGGGAGEPESAGTRGASGYHPLP